MHAGVFLKQPGWGFYEKRCMGLYPDIVLVLRSFYPAPADRFT